MGYTLALILAAAFCFQGSHANSVTYGDLGTFFYGVGAPACHEIMPESPEANGISFNLYTNLNKHTPEVLDRTIPLTITNSNFNRLHDTKFVIHGYVDTYSSPWQQELKDALLTKNVNVIMVDWNLGASHVPDYLQSAANTRVVGAEVGAFIDQLRTTESISLASVHLIGHSLGAHTAGYAGEARPGLARISGLDPAGPGFRPYDMNVCMLDPTDADFVDAIHTDGDVYGLTNVCGHQDFYPNGGITQPGCDPTLIPCNHMTVVPLYTESVITSCQFTATQKCNSFSDYPVCPTCGLSCPEMGYNAKYSDGQGLFFLDTNAQSPYCI